MEKEAGRYIQEGVNSLATGGKIAAMIAERFTPRKETKAVLTDALTAKIGTIYRRLLQRP